VRAQLLQAEGQSDRARSIVDYLAKVGGAGPRLIEETPAGPVIATTDDRGVLWSRYLAAHLAEAPAPRRGAASDGENDGPAELRFPNPFEGLDARGLDDGRPPFLRRRRFGGPPAGPGDGGFGGRPFGLDRPLRGFPPIPPRPQPVVPPFPRFQRLDRAIDRASRTR
jgi:hypothetical protein